MTLLLATLLAACGATPNPPPPTTPAPWNTSATEGAPVRATTNQAVETPPATAAAKPANAAPAATRDAGSAPPDVTSSSQSDADAPLTIATVAGKPIDVRELLAQWLHRDSIEVLDQLDRLVIDRLVLAEAARLGLRIDPERAESAYRKAVATIEGEIAKKRPGVTLDEYVDKMLGLDPLVYREGMRADALRAQLAERVIRCFILQSEHAQIRVIVVKTEDEVRAVEAALAAGEAFDAVATRLSTDPSAKNGGRVAPVVRSGTVMGRLAFETEAGQVGGPTYEQGAWLFVRVEQRPQPLTGLWLEIAPLVEASLAERGVENIEMQQWESAMHRRYEIDVRPLLRLAGQPVPDEEPEPRSGRPSR